MRYIHSITSKLRSLTLFAKVRLAQYGLFSKKGRRPIIILMYHGIDIDENTTYNHRFFSASNFAQHIQLFKKHCNILTHEDFVKGNLSKQKQNLLITFDDGYENNYKYALPILEKYEAHAYFFITGLDTLETKILWADAVDIVSKHGTAGSIVTLDGKAFTLTNGDFMELRTGLKLKSYIKDSDIAEYSQKEALIKQLLGIFDFTKRPELEDYWRLMNEEQITKAADSKFITIGSHGFYHHNLGSLKHNDAVQEIKQSRAYLEGITNKQVDTIAYPDGSYTTDLTAAMKAEGFDKQFLVGYRFDGDLAQPYTYDRFGLYPYLGNANIILFKAFES